MRQEGLHATSLGDACAARNNREMRLSRHQPGMNVGVGTAAGERIREEGAGSEDTLPYHGTPAQADAGHDG